MRFNSKSYPILESLERGDAMNMPIDAYYTTHIKDPQTILTIASAAVETYKTCKANKFFMTKTFKTAIEKSAPKIVSDQKHIEHKKNDAAVFFDEQGLMCFIANPIDGITKFICFGFSKTALISMCVITPNGQSYGHWPVKDEKTGLVYNDKDGMIAWGHAMMVAAYFFRNCEIDTVLVKPNQKVRYQGEKHLNETREPITILDCKWFTEMIRDIPFGVKGHFRWQPHGPQHSKRKLIWIAEFEKKGYHRKAGVAETQA